MIVDTEILKKHNLTGIRALEVFMLHAENEAFSIHELTGFEPPSPAYRAHYSRVRKLMNGDLTRNDGLQLLCFGDLVPGASHHKEYSILLTPKGREVYEDLRETLK